MALRWRLLFCLLFCGSAVAMTDLNQQELLVRRGFQEPVISAWPASTRDWLVLPAAADGNRQVIVSRIGFPDLPKPAFLTFQSHPPQSFTFLSRVHLRPSDMTGNRNYGIFLGSIGVNWRIFVNGHLVDQEMHPDAEGGIAVPRMVRGRLSEISGRFLHPGENIIAIQIKGDPARQETGFYYGKPFLFGEVRDLRRKRDETIQLILASLYLFVGLYHFLLFVKRPRERYNFFFGLFCAGIFLYFMLRSFTVFDLFSNTDILYRVELFTVFQLVPLLMIFFAVLLENKVDIFALIYQVLCSCLALAALLVPFVTTDGILRTWQLTAPYPLVYFLGYRLGVPVAKSLRQYYRNGSGFFPLRLMRAFNSTLSGTTAGNLLLGMLVIIFASMFDVLDSAIFRTGFGAMQYGFFVFVMGIATLLANKFLRLHREVEELNANLEQKVIQKTAELQSTLEEVQALKVQQDGDYFLTSLLLQPLGRNEARNPDVSVEFFIRQKKKFSFRKWNSELGGDLCAAHDIVLRGRDYTVFLNADAMGKSLQGAGGALVLGAVFHSIIERTTLSEEYGTRHPEQWLRLAFKELQKVFESFDGSMLVSLVLGITDPSNGMMYFINAEHPFTVLYRDRKASFLEDDMFYRKLGTSGMEGQLQINTFQLREGDIILLGSDGRDDLEVAMDEAGNRVINEDETLFLRIVERSAADLNAIHEHLLQAGSITDDLSLLRMAFREGGQVRRKKSDETAGLMKKIHTLIRGGDLDLVQKILERRDFAGVTDPNVLATLVDLNLKFGLVEKAGFLAESYTYMRPDEMKYYRIVAECRKNTGKLQEALDWRERMLLRSRRDAENLLEMAEICRELGDRKKAGKYARQALHLKPDSERAKKLAEYEK